MKTLEMMNKAELDGKKYESRAEQGVISYDKELGFRCVWGYTPSIQDLNRLYNWKEYEEIERPKTFEFW